MGLSPFFTDEKAGAGAPAAAWGHQGGFPGSWDLYSEGQAGAGQVISGVKGQLQDEKPYGSEDGGEGDRQRGVRSHWMDP